MFVCLLHSNVNYMVHWKAIYTPYTSLNLPTLESKITFQVTMIDAKGIYLSSKNKKEIMITKSPLVAVISGGTERTVSKRKGPITLSASSSHDPDHPDEHKNLRSVFLSYNNYYNTHLTFFYLFHQAQWGFFNDLILLYSEYTLKRC